MLPDSSMLVHYMTRRLNRLLGGLQIDAARMRRNLWSSHGLVFSQPVLLALVAAGTSRDDAYRIVQRNAMSAWDTGTDFRTLLEDDPEVTLDKEALDEAFDLERSLRHLDRVAAALDELRPLRRAADAGPLEHGGRDADLPPGGVRDALALAVAGGHLDERVFDGPEVDLGAHAASSSVEVAALLDQPQLAERIGRLQLFVDGVEPLLDRIRRPLAAPLWLVGAQRVEVVANGPALGPTLGEGRLVIVAHWAFRSPLRCHRAQE